MVQDIIGALRFISLGAFLAFGVGYQWLTQGRWRHRPEGWWLMALVFIIIEFIAYAVTVQIWGPAFPGRTAFSLAVWVTLAAWPISLLILLIRAQLRSRRTRTD